MSAHLYWRLDFTLANYVAIAEVEMFTTVGGTDQCTGGTATSSGHFGGQTPAMAFDNSASTYWETSGTTGPFWLAYQFPSAVDIVEFNFTHNAPSPGEHPATVGLSYSDNGSTWTVAMAAKPTDEYTAGRVSTYRVSGANTKSFWRIKTTATETGVYTEIAELELRSSVGGADQTTNNGATKADTVFSTDKASNAFDNSTATLWGSGSGLPHTLFYRFPQDINIVQYVITARASGGGANYAPKSWTLEYSGDGTTWTVADTQTAVANWTIGESRTYTLSGGAAARPSVFVCT